jgi:hypothetical protein
MKNKITIGLVIVAAVVAGALGAWFFMPSACGIAGERVEKEQKMSKTVRSGSVKKITEISVDRKGGKKSVRIVESEATRPDVIKDADIDDAEQLSPIQKSVLKEIQAALDADDVKALRKALSKFTASTKKGGLGGYENVPRVIRAAAVQALGWFGKDAAIDMIDFMADADEEISDDAFDQFEQALLDCEMGDRERSALVKAVSKALKDSDRIDAMISCLSDMRNSVKADTAIAILTDGSDQSKAALLDEMEFYFDEGVQTVDDIKKWMAENPDDPDDDDFYAGSKE